MILTLLGGFAACPLGRAALRYGAIALFRVFSYWGV